MKYDHGAPQSLRVTLDCPNEYDAHEHDQELNGGAEGFCCVESTAEKHTSACMISKKLHRPAGAGSHRHRFRTTRIPPNARTRAPPPDIPRETLGSVFCYIPSMLGPSQGVLPFKSRRIGLHRARHCFVARTAPQQEDGRRGPEQPAPQATDQVPRQTSEDSDPASYTARLTYPLRFARRSANDCYKLQRIGLERGPDQRGWTQAHGRRQRRSPRRSPRHAVQPWRSYTRHWKKAFWNPVSLYSFSKRKTRAPPGFSKKTRFVLENSPNQRLRPERARLTRNQTTCSDRSRTSTSPHVHLLGTAHGLRRHPLAGPNR